MLYRPSQSPKNSISTQKVTQSEHTLAQYGFSHSSSLLDLPAESLTHITCFLDPWSLFALTVVNKTLHRHVEADNTWHRAFAYQFLDIGPESDLEGVQNSMLRRNANSWKQEFVYHYNLRRRWERSNNTTITHVPHHSPVTNMHIMPSHTLLTTSLQYGVVARSVPLTGKVLRGFFDPSNTGPANGNPNAEFAPSVTACAVASEGGTAKIVWGLRHGEVIVTSASKATEVIGKAAAKITRCPVNDEHGGSVLDVVFDGAKVVTGGADGVVKVFDGKSVKCLWASMPKEPVPDSYVKVASALSQGIIAAATRNGEIVVWSGFDFDELNSPQENRIPCFSGQEDVTEVKALYIDNSANILVLYADAPQFHRIDAYTISSSHAYGDESFGPISCLTPYFINKQNESGFVLVGDHLGYVNFYSWNNPSQHPVRKIEAFEDGETVTALYWNSVTLLVGSEFGTIKAFDGLNFEPLRRFASPSFRSWATAPVSQILVGPEKEMMVASIGERVLAWRAGPVKSSKYGGIKGRSVGSPSKKREKHAAAKFYKQIELTQSINESRQLLDYESQVTRRTFGREREQRNQLEHLGLDEVEAVEYVLMLSRDEAESQRMSSLSLHDHNSGSSSSAHQEVEMMFDGDFGSDFQGFYDPQTDEHMPTPRIQSPAYSPWITAESSRQSSVANISNGNAIPLTPSRSSSSISSNGSNNKVQVSPRARPEPVQAGPWNSPSTSRAVAVPPARHDATQFPSINPRSSTSSRAATSIGSAWSTPPELRDGMLTSASSSISSGSGLAGNNRSIEGNGRNERSEFAAEVDEDEDEDLKFALELSLAEARSQGIDI